LSFCKRSFNGQFGEVSLPAPHFPTSNFNCPAIASKALFTQIQDQTREKSSLIKFTSPTAGSMQVPMSTLMEPAGSHAMEGEIGQILDQTGFESLGLALPSEASAMRSMEVTKCYLHGPMPWNFRQDCFGTTCRMAIDLFFGSDASNFPIPQNLSISSLLR